MSMIDPTARVEDGAVIGEGTSIGPYCVIGPCRDRRQLPADRACADDGAHHDRQRCTIYPFVSLGAPPQSLSSRAS